jgi:hypothetical protein
MICGCNHMGWLLLPALVQNYVSRFLPRLTHPNDIAPMVMQSYWDVLQASQRADVVVSGSLST